MSSRTVGLALLWPIAFASATLAASSDPDRPRLRPTTDIDVTYQVNGGGSANGQTLEQRVRWLAAANMMRIDPPTPGLYVIIDYPARRMSVVRVGDRSAIEMAAPDTVGGITGAPAAGTYIRRGDDKVAGVNCTDWETTGRAGAPTVACITGDGVLLRVRSGSRTLVSAMAVHYAPQDPKAFQVPADYTRQRAENAR